MSERRFVTSSAAGCPRCGCDSALVRVRGNAFAATCTSCGFSEIAPMLGARELRDVCDEREPAPVAQLSYERMRRIGSRTTCSNAPSVPELERQLDAKRHEIAALRDSIAATLPFDVSLRLPTS